MKKRNPVHSQILISIFLCFAYTMVSQIPINPSVQMLITDNDGILIADGQHEITTKLYESISGNNNIWTESQTVNVNNGLVNLILGKIQSLNLSFDKSYYLGISIDGGDEMDPRLELNSSVYSLSARAVYGTTNIFPSSGSVGIGSTAPKAKLDIRGNLRVADVSLADSNIYYKVLVQDTLDKIIKYIPNSSIQGPRGLKGDKGEPGSNRLPGEDLIVLNNDSVEVFKVNASDGTSFHFGKETFKDSIVLENKQGNPSIELNPDGSIFVYNSTGYKWLTISSEITSFNSEAEGLLAPSGSAWIGPSRETWQDSEGNIIREHDQNGSRHERINEFGGGLTVPFDNGGKLEILPDGTFTIKDSLGNIITQFDINGSFHAGLETYPGGIQVPDEIGGRIELLPDGGMTMWDPGGNITNQIRPDTTRLSGLTILERGMVIPWEGGTTEIFPDGRIVCRDLEGNISSSFGPDGSLNSGLSEYAGGIEVPFDNGGRIEILPDRGMTMWDPDGSIDFRIDPEGDVTFHDSDGNIITNFNEKGSYQAEIAEFESGIDINLDNGGKIHLCHECGIVLRNTAGDDLYRIDPDGASYHEGHEIFFGGINTYNSDVQPSIRAQAIIADQLTATEKNFRIDHPLDPDNKYLYHTSMESSERLNLYNGNTILDINGEAIITLPDWFEALNENYRYQLTPIGGAAPNLFVALEVNNNQFSIAGGSPGMKISWQISGTRKDAYARANQVKLEVDKTANERGKYWNTPTEPKNLKSTIQKCKSH